MRVVALAGGVGSARFLTGLVRVVDPSDLTLIANVGDDEEIRGFYVCPDIDTVLYHLANASDWDRGWGLAEETFTSQTRYAELVANLKKAAPEIATDLQEWFSLGDKDIATHMLRARLLSTGATLAEATEALRKAMGIGCRMIPATNDRLRTLLTTKSGEELDFQTYFVKHQTADEVAAVTYSGSDKASAAPGIAEAIRRADILVIPPSNPVLTVAPILAVSELAAAWRESKAKKLGVSPIVGGRAIKGPADKVLASLGFDASVGGVSDFYAGLLDTLAVDISDGEVPHPARRPKWFVTNTIMTGPEEAARLAKELLEA